MTIENLEKIRKRINSFNFDIRKPIKNIDGLFYKLIIRYSNTGEAEGEINLGRDREPIYAIDKVGKMVYYQESGKSLIGYKIK